MDNLNELLDEYEACGYNVMYFVDNPLANVDELVIENKHYDLTVLITNTTHNLIFDGCDFTDCIFIDTGSVSNPAFINCSLQSCHAEYEVIIVSSSWKGM